LECLWIWLNYFAHSLITMKAPIPLKEECKYLGMNVNQHGINFTSSFNDRTQNISQMIKFFSFRGMTANGWRPQVNLTLYKTFIRPTIEYGLVLRPLEKTLIDNLQSIQNMANLLVF
jgi:hypothetical protein